MARGGCGLSEGKRARSVNEGPAREVLHSVAGALHGELVGLRLDAVHDIDGRQALVNHFSSSCSREESMPVDP